VVWRAQEGVAIEVAEAVAQSLAGELSSNTVNAPMVAPEVLKELQPYITLAQGLGKTAVQLVAETGISGAHLVHRAWQLRRAQCSRDQQLKGRP
jgi:D-3-phosphoglycerate dehydrogenase / 2-oxoglutarate reductase